MREFREEQAVWEERLAADPECHQMSASSEDEFPAGDLLAIVDPTEAMYRRVQERRETAGERIFDSRIDQ